MITPVVIQILFWLGSIYCIVSGMRVIIASFDAGPSVRLTADGDVDFNPGRGGRGSSSFSTWAFVYGVLLVLVGPLLVRILCELDVILFKIHDELKAANDRERYRKRE
jgi:hypothetical protein